MSKNILVTTDVFAAIWAAREQGEDSEDAILRRILECESSGEDLEQFGNLEFSYPGSYHESEGSYNR